MTDFERIDKARKTLGLDEYATIEEVKSAYRDLAAKVHPDKCPDAEKKECEKLIKKINNARDILMVYCAGYQYSFKERDVERSVMDKDLRDYLKRYYDGWCGNLDL